MVLLDVASAQVALETAAQPVWVCITEHAAFCPRDTAEPFIFDGKMWLSNGYISGGALIRDLWRSADGVTWELVTDSTPYDGYAEMVVYRDKIWAVKGSVWNSTDGVNWDQVLARTPFGVRPYGELVVCRDEMWQLGSGSDVWHSADGETWKCAVAEAPYGARYGSAVAVYKDKLWLMAGATQEVSDPPEKHYRAFTTHNDVWCSEDGSHWSRVLEHAPWPPRMWVVAEVYAGRLWILGGFSNRDSVNFAEAWSTEDGVTWTPCTSEPIFSARHEVSPFVFDGSLWVVAGNMWPLMHDVWRLTLSGASG